VDERGLFVLADRTLDGVVQRVREEQWGMPMPADFQTRRDASAPPTLREVLNYHAYDDAWVPAVLAGQPLDAEGPTVEDDLLGSDPRRSFSELVGTACAAAEGLDDLGRTVHCSYGDFPAREYLQHVTTFRGLRAHDIAAALGQDAALPEDLVAGMWEVLEPQAEAWRAMGVFGPEVPVPDDAPLQDRLLGLTGRRPAAR